MNQKLLLVAGGILAAAAVVYFGRTGAQPPAAATQGAIGMHKVPAGGSICISPIQNKSGKDVNMEGMEEAFAGQLNKAGFQARTLDQSGACDATIHAEVVDVKGRDRMSAEVDFRMVLAGEESPRVSATAKGKGPEPPPAGVVSSFADPAKKELLGKPDHARAEREALTAAFSDAADRIVTAQRMGLPARASVAQ